MPDKENNQLKSFSKTAFDADSGKKWFMTITLPHAVFRHNLP